jgi:hypothetical protein
MDVGKATAGYEKWLRGYTPLIDVDLKKKHEAMRSGTFPFLRSTFYRWVQLFPKTCADIFDAPRVLAVGDLHIENFGTWRDTEGRLIWGVNDFDEAAYMPYVNDLVRLATSALLAIRTFHLAQSDDQCCDAILDGYTEGLKQKGSPFVLEEKHEWLRGLASGALRDPVAFWKKMELLPAANDVPESAVVAIEHLLPPGTEYSLRSRVAGLGSLGHPRYVAIADYLGGKVAREAKALVPSSTAWARDTDGVPEIFYQAIVDRSIRCADPYVKLEGHWIVRRLAPDCSRVELNGTLDAAQGLKLLGAMGWETANIHLGSPGAFDAVCKDLKRRSKSWLTKAANAMADETGRDQEAFGSLKQ